MSRTSAREQQPRQGDLTGVAKARLAAEHAADLAAREAEIALITANAAPENQEPVDIVTNESRPKPAPVITEVEAIEVDVEDKIVSFRVNENLEQVTIGYANTYDFKMGQQYRAPQSIYDYLDERGFVWH